VTALGAVPPTIVEQPRTTVDPDPEPLPPGPDRLAALVAEGAAGDELDLGGWQDAATALINTVVDDTSPPGPPVFTDVSQAIHALIVRGRYSMPDGDAGTFELVRLDDGRWGMTQPRRLATRRALRECRARGGVQRALRRLGGESVPVPRCTRRDEPEDRRGVALPGAGRRFWAPNWLESNHFGAWKLRRRQASAAPAVTRRANSIERSKMRSLS
jgi:hypothetical protein